MTKALNCDMVITLSGKDGIFRVEKELFVWRKHTTTTDWKQVRKQIVAEMRKLLKNGSVTIDVYDMPQYKRNDYVRMIVNQWGTEIDYREFDGVDFSDSTIHQFPTKQAETKWILERLDTCFEEIVGIVPDAKSYYAQQLAEERIQL